MLGATFAAAAPFVPEWQTGFDNGNNVGGLVQAVLAPAGGFGKFLTVVIALFIPSACAPTMYSFASSTMTIHAWFARVPRYVYTIISEAMYVPSRCTFSEFHEVFLQRCPYRMIPVAIVGATHFYTTFVNILNVIGYWSTVFAAIVLVEHFVFRKNDWALYDLSQWNKPRELPLGIAAIFAFLCACGIIVPCMSQVWYVGPIANAGAGDIGVLVGFFLAALLYPVYRAIERAVSRR